MLRPACNGVLSAAAALASRAVTSRGSSAICWPARWSLTAVCLRALANRFVPAVAMVRLPRLQQAQCGGQRQHLDEDFVQEWLVLLAEFADRVVVRMRVAGQKPDGDIGVGGLLNGAGAERAGGLAGTEQAQHQVGRELRVARAALVDAQSGQWEAVHGLEEEVGAVVFGDPLPEIGQQQQWRIAVDIDESCRHTKTDTATRSLFRNTSKNCSPKVRQAARGTCPFIPSSTIWSFS